MANARRRQNRTNMFNSLLAAGYDAGTAGSIANTRLSPESDGSNLRIKKKSRKRRQELSKGTGQLRINPTQSANVSTAGQAAASGGINI